MPQAARDIGRPDVAESTRIVSVELDYADYLALLLKDVEDQNLRMWHTRYALLLHGENPVADFTRSTGFMPFIEACGGSASDHGKRIWAAYSHLMKETYARHVVSDITIFPSNRFFLVAQKNV